MSDTFEEDFLAALLAGADVAALVGTRGSWAELPQAKPRPLLVLWSIFGDPEYVMSGAEGLEQRLIQIDCRAALYATASALGRAIIARFTEVARTIHGGTDFQGLFVRNVRDPGVTDSDATIGEPCVSVDVMVWFRAVA